MAAVITDPAQFYRFAAPEIWKDINPQLGEHLRIAEAVREGLRTFNIAYPPPPPGSGWTSALGTVILVVACCAVVGAAVLSASAASSAATAAPSVASSAATGVNTAAASAATASGTTVGATVTASQAAGVATKLATYAAPIAKAIGTVTGNTTAQKVGAAADVISGSTTFTEGVITLYKREMASKNATLTAEGENELRALAYAEQQKYAEYLRQQAAEKARADAGTETKLPAWILPAAGIITAVIVGA